MNRQIASQTHQEAPAPALLAGGLLQRKCDCGQHTIAGGECETCKKNQTSLQRASRNSELETRNSGGVPPIVHEVPSSPGQPLDAATRAFVAPRLGHDFSSVPAHTTLPGGKLPGGDFGFAHQLMQATQARTEAPRDEAILREAMSRQDEVVSAWSSYDEPKGGKKPAPPKEAPPKKEPPAQSEATPKTGPTCNAKFLLFTGEKGSVNFYAVGKQQLMQAGKTEVKDEKTATTGSSYIAAAEVDPKDCGELQFVQNVQSNRVVTFKDASQLEENTPWCLDTSDPYPTFPLADLSKDKLKAVSTNDSPGQGTGGVDGFVDTLTVKDTFKLFLMVKSKTGRKTVGLANWNWEGKLATTDKKDTKAALKFDSGKVEAPEGAASTEAPLLAPNVTEQKFKIIGKGKTLASVFEKVFNGSK